MYYRTSGYLNPILPRSDLTPAVVTDNFDERIVINDDLNMNGYFIYNLKGPEDDHDAVTKMTLIQSNITSTAHISQETYLGLAEVIFQHFFLHV